MRLFYALSHRPFALVWLGQTVSRLGDSLYRVALAWWVLEETGSATAMGTVLVFSSTPMLIFLLLGGVVVDRLPRLRVMLTADVLNGLVVATVTALNFAGQLELWHVYTASIIFGLVEAFFFPAYNAAVPDLVPADALPSANSLTSLSLQLAGVAGPALGAGLVAAGGTALAFGIDALSFGAAAVCLLPLAARLRLGPRPAGGQSASPLRDLRDGLAVVVQNPWLWITIVVFGLINITAAGPRAVSLPFLVSEDLDAEVNVLGLLLSLASAGSVVGAVWLGRYARLRRRGWLAYGATLLVGLSLIVFGLLPPLPVIAAAALVSGAANSAFGLVWTNTLQEMVPREKLGRVASIDALGSFVLLPVGFGAAGWLTDLLGAPLVFVAGGAVTLLLAGLALLHPAIRGLD